MLSLQEIKATPEQLEKDMHSRLTKGYHAYWHPAEKLGYSGTAILAKREPLRVFTGIGDAEIDREGRVLVADFGDHVVVNAYFPNSQRDHARLPFKLRFCGVMLKFLEKQREAGKHVLLCGDLNIAHQDIDLRNPKTNRDNAGFLPEEREWMTKFLAAGYVDTFRKFEPGPDHYTWWSQRPGVRAKNVGWRLDYFVCNEEASDRLKKAEHRPAVMGSDHCPVVLTLRK